MSWAGGKAALGALWLVVLSTTHSAAQSQLAAAFETTTPEEEVVRWLAQRAVPIASAERSEGGDEWSFLDDAVGEAEVVLLGEEVHGVREFAALKRRMVRYLVEQHGFDTLVLEQDTLGCAAVDRLLQGAEGEVAGSTRRFYWCWDEPELSGLLAWLREHNEDADRPVHLVGVDNQGIRAAAERLRALAAGLPADEAFDPEPSIAPFQRERSDYPKDDARAVEAHAGELAGLRAHIEDLREKLGDEGGSEALDSVRILEEVFALWSAPNTNARMNHRDRHMAERTLSLVLDEGRRVVVWAHNAHVSRATFYGGVQPMGAHVSREVPTLVAGFYFGGGEYLLDPRARSEEGADTRKVEPRPGSLGMVLSAVRGGTWAADLRSIEPAQVRRFFEAPPPGYFENYSEPPSLVGAIDTLIFVERVRPLESAPR